MRLTSNLGHPAIPATGAESIPATGAQSIQATANHPFRVTSGEDLQHRAEPDHRPVFAGTAGLAGLTDQSFASVPVDHSHPEMDKLFMRGP